jgi:hypothetical protein
LRFRLELAELALRDPVELLERVMTHAASLYEGAAAPAPAATWRMPEAALPPSLAGGEPPPPDEADRRADAGPGLARPALAGASARAEVERMMADIDDLYPL